MAGGEKIEKIFALFFLLLQREKRQISAHVHKFSNFKEVTPLMVVVLICFCSS